MITMPICPPRQFSDSYRRMCLVRLGWVAAMAIKRFLSHLAASGEAFEKQRRRTHWSHEIGHLNRFLPRRRAVVQWEPAVLQAVDGINRGQFIESPESLRS